MVVAWACEAHNTLQTEVATLQQKRSQMLFAARNFELLAEEADVKLQSVRQQVDMLIRVALDQIAASEVVQEQQRLPVSCMNREGFGNNFLLFLGNNN